MAKKPPRSRAEKADAQNAHLAIVRAAAQAVVTILHNQHISCAVFGSLACKLYGSSRCPKDVDLLVLQDSSSETTLTPHQLKVLMLDSDPRHFYLKLPRDPTADYLILWYREWYLGPECKVDILVPGIMHLPAVPPAKLRWVDGVPLVPFSVALLHKLQGWDDHRKADETHKNQKQHQDAGDLRKLMAVKEEVAHVRACPPWDDPELFSDEFRELTRVRIDDFCRAFPDRAEKWRLLRFE